MVKSVSQCRITKMRSQLAVTCLLQRPCYFTRSRLREAVTKDKKELLEGLLHDSPDSLDSTYEVSRFKGKGMLFQVLLQNGAGLLHLAAGYGIQRCLLVLLAADRSKVSDQDKVRFVYMNW